MGHGYLIDTNTAIDYLNDKLPDNAASLIDNTANLISVITRMEMLAWPKATPQHLASLHAFISNSIVFNLEEAIILSAIDIRRNYILKLPDAIIAATALVYNLTLITRNVADFKNIKALSFVNPYER